MIRTLAALALTALPMGGCLGTAPAAPPAPAGVTFTIPEEWPWDFDALPGDRLDILLIPESLAEGSPEERCDRMGGAYRLDRTRNLELCEGVDF